jgi:hypothetical protein
VSTPSFESFVVFAEMRTGSNFLESNLNAMSGVSCLGEAFNPHFVGVAGQTSLFGLDIAERDRDPSALLARMKKRTAGLSGFRFFHDHDPRVLDAVIADRSCAKIILTRNPIESYVSLKIAQATGQWKLTNVRSLKSAKVTFDGDEFERHVGMLQRFQIEVLKRLQRSGQTAFYLDYEDIGDIEVLNGLAAFLGVNGRLEATDQTLKKQNPEEVLAKVSNPDAVEPALARLDRFNLSRTPNFEPRRGAAIPTFVAAKGAPILFMPIRSGPDAAVTEWMGQIGSGGTLSGLVRKDLRQWKKSRPGHRSFTVLRHPLLRAHEAFCALVLGGRMPQVTQVLANQQKIKLPAADKIAEMTLDAHVDAFLGFLRFVKLNLAGQTNLRVDQNWATQSAVLEGFSNYQSPDHLFREDSLGAGLAWLAREVGVGAPAYVPAPSGAAHDLGDFYDAEIEAAAADTYQRDYIGFGFGPWR